MTILSISPLKPELDRITQAARILKRGGVIVYPTDTCYGLGADARSELAHKRIAAMKGRDQAKRFSVIVKDLDQAKEVAELTPEQEQIFEHYLPGAYTFIVLNADFRIATGSTVGIRIPDYPVTQAIAESFGEPFITTSANISGAVAPYSCHEINEGLIKEGTGPKPDLLINAGDLPQNPPSTVVDLTPNPPKIIRQGGAEFRWPI